MHMSIDDTSLIHFYYTLSHMLSVQHHLPPQLTLEIHGNGMKIVHSCSLEHEGSFVLGLGIEGGVVSSPLILDGVLVQMF